MTAKELSIHLKNAICSGNADVEVQHITSDSRKVKVGSMFVAIRGGVDGHQFIEAAIAQGAVAIVAEASPSLEQDGKICWLHVKDSHAALAALADTFFGNPSMALRTIGVTGTNGKTTTTSLIHHVMKTVWRRAGLMGTIKFDDGNSEYVASHTTPDAMKLHELLGKMVANDCRGVAMEVSSHGLEQKRVGSVRFDVGVFSNLTQDHLDYHLTMDAYFKAKLLLFENMISDIEKATDKYRPVAVINADDNYGQRMLKEIGDRMMVWTYGMSAHCDFKVSSIRQTFKGITFQLDVKGKSYLVKAPLIGKFNVYNLVSAIAACSAAGMKIRDAVKALEEAPQVPGRMENVGNVNGVGVFVDYAHTPDALENACSTLRELEPRNLVTVFGCGGDRDTAKRPLMGEAAAKHSEMCIVTSDNPRSEEPEAIIEMIERGMVGKKFKSIVDRAEAIETAIKVAARPGDLVLIAGKGHETYQQFATETIDFDDCAVARRVINEHRVSDLKERIDKVKEQDALRAKREKYENRNGRGDRDRDNRDRPPRREERKRDE